MKDAGVSLLVGRRGTGKTTRLRKLIKGERRLIVFSPIPEWPDLDLVRNLKDLAYLVRRDRAFRIQYMPPDDQEAHALDALCRSVLFPLQQPYFEGVRRAQKLCLVVDELNLAFGSRRESAAPAFRRAVLQGRHYGLELIGATQRPALVSPDFRDNCEALYIGALSDATSLGAIGQLVGREHLDQVRQLKGYECLCWSEGTLKSVK